MSDDPPQDPWGDEGSVPILSHQAFEPEYMDLDAEWLGDALQQH